MGGARVFLPGGHRAGHGGAVADSGLVIGRGHGRGSWRVHGLPDGVKGFGATFFFARHASGE